MGGVAVKKMLFSLDEVVNIVSTLRIHAKSHKCVVESVVIDSREAAANSLFIALPGTKTDGHNFIKNALNRGASSVIMKERWYNRLRGEIIPLAESRGAAVIVVSDPLNALQQLGKMYLKRFSSLVKLGITGSSGKTTTKEMVASVLSLNSHVVANIKNLNSEIGVPLTAFRVNSSHEYAVFEMGTNHPGEMSVLANIVRPKLGLITNIGKAHIEYFNSKEAIAAEKASLFKYFSGKETAFLPDNEVLLKQLKRGINGRVLFFGAKSTAGYGGYKDRGLDGITVHWEGLPIQLSLYGKYNVLNALAAISLAVELGVSGKDIKEGLEMVQPLFGRSQIVRGEVTVLLDCYNSNPDSARKALEFLESVKWPGRKIALLGAMYELGAQTETEHMELAEFANRMNLDILFLFGDEFKASFEKLMSFSKGKRLSLLWEKDFDGLIRAVKKVFKTGDLVLLKASRGVELEQILPLIKEI
ncbi:MAG: UDP-N-acetylmuramoyl-tripeptide--D-alanyl-D-alanine ligase [Spirochaetes bacterium]|nr:MAG: UDP-N-acetylmuramoyl-tripeptide--D-alanyl-D-alanine ligase [Spirochaetota bacterium]